MFSHSYNGQVKKDLFTCKIQALGFLLKQIFVPFESEIAPVLQCYKVSYKKVAGNIGGYSLLTVSKPIQEYKFVRPDLSSFLPDRKATLIKILEYACI